ncbi:hypothetical protein ACOALZ_03815 [Nocardiopsis algeriensis]|uniref:hypothetical protein n=1 Tax=Nocardiopsis algeriensis TaxID=1478215 RepID=UPI003B432E4D
MPPIEDRRPEADLRSQQPLDLDYTTLIFPPAIPRPPASAESLEESASAMRKAASEISEDGASIESTWQGLQPHYTAPESEQLFSVMGIVASKGTTIQEDVSAVADALETFAGEARSAKERMDTLRDDAWDFYNEHKDDELWKLNPVNLAVNASLKLSANRIWGDYQEAERTCANTIAAISGTRHNYVAAGDDASGNLTFTYGIDPDDVPQLPTDLSEISLDDLKLINEITWSNIAYGDLPGNWEHPRDAGMSIWDNFGPGNLWDVGVGVVVSTGLWTDRSGWANSPREALVNFGDHKVQLGLSVAALAGLYGEQGLMNPFDEDSRDGEVWQENMLASWGEVAHEFFPWTELEDRPAYAYTSGGTNLAMTFLAPPVKGIKLAVLFSRGDLLSGVPDNAGLRPDGQGGLTIHWDNGVASRNEFKLPDWLDQNKGDYADHNSRLNDLLARLRGVDTDFGNRENQNTNGTPGSGTGVHEEHTPRPQPPSPRGEQDSHTPGTPRSDDENTGQTSRPPTSTAEEAVDAADQRLNGRSNGTDGPDRETPEQRDGKDDREGEGAQSHPEPDTGAGGGAAEPPKNGGGGSSSDGDGDGDGDGDEKPEGEKPDEVLLAEQRSAEIESTLREGGLTQEQIDQIRGGREATDRDWQRIGSALSQRFGQKVYDDLHPLATEFAFEGADSPQVFAYRYEYYKAIFDEMSNDLKKNEGLGKKQAPLEAARRMPEVDVQSMLESDEEIAVSLRPNHGPIHVDSSPEGLHDSIREAAGRISMPHETSTSYHARKHPNAIPEGEITGNLIKDYILSAENTLRYGEIVERTPAGGGAEKIVVRRPMLSPNGTHETDRKKRPLYLEAILYLKPDSTIIMATFDQST